VAAAEGRAAAAEAAAAARAAASQATMQSNVPVQLSLAVRAALRAAAGCAAGAGSSSSSIAVGELQQAEASQLQQVVAELPDSVLKQFMQCCREVAMHLQKTEVKEQLQAIQVPCC